ncbi:MAG: alpha/beta hydrolase [Clostridia bacterium]|nr:alpha/beta hydrolase [Clostridia bacterium]
MPESFQFLSADGKTQVHAEIFRPEGSPKAVLQLIHGMVEHIGRYRRFAEWLAGQGFVVAGHDHLGHGATGKPEDWGYFGAPDPSGLLVKDIHSLRERVQKEYPGLPYFMLGHSMGSYLLRKYLTWHGEGLSGAVVMGTGFMPGAAAAGGLAVIHSAELLKGARHKSRTVEKLVFGSDYQHFDMSGKEPSRSWLTKDEDIVRQYYSDPRTTFRFTLNGYQGLVEAVRDACDPKGAARIPKDLPVLLISGADDPVGSFGKGVRETETQLKQAGLKDVTCHLIEGDRHEVLNETDREQVYGYLLDWFRAYLKG